MWDKQKEVFLPSTPGLGMHVEVKDPEGKVGLPLVALRCGMGALQTVSGILHRAVWDVQSSGDMRCGWRGQSTGGGFH